mmetsp:Transcript_9018/g.25913  ORF Transcript_9018/g.25913 Transcript_9018/m.25913 type:complete len:289 (+) Transcript_9018:204-1070(+)
MACLNSSTSLLRISRRSARSSRVALMSSLRAEISSSNRFASSSKRSMVLPAFSMCAFKSSMSFLFLPSAFWHRSRCAMSSCSSLRSTSTIASIAAITLSKCPPAFNMCAIFSALSLPNFADNCASFVAAAARRPSGPPRTRRVAESCTRVVEERSKIFFASSLERIWTHLAMPASSSVRSLVRSLHSAAFTWQPSLVSAKKTSSAANCSFVVSRIPWLSANFLDLLASSAVCCSSVACKASASCSFVRINSSWDFCASASSALDFSRSPTNVSYMPLRMPWIWVDCGA